MIICFVCMDKTIIIVEKGTYNDCACGCGLQVAKPHNKFINGHNNKKSSKVANVMIQKYVLLKKKDHRYLNSKGYVQEHRVIFEEHYKCCLLKHAHIHHKNENKLDNRIENLEGMTNVQHIRLHNMVDMSNRRCEICKSTKTYMRKDNKLIRPRWAKYKDGYICNNCRINISRKKQKNKIGDKLSPN